jgi:CxxC motif-containing protein
MLAKLLPAPARKNYWISTTRPDAVCAYQIVRLQKEGLDMSEFTCVVCPWGCLLKADGANISGYSCSRGFEYARKEQTDPRRSISGTVRINGSAHRVVPVKTSEPIPKDLLLAAAALLYTTVVSAPVKTGDVIIPDILDTGIDFIAARSMEADAG